MPEKFDFKIPDGLPDFRSTNIWKLAVPAAVVIVLVLFATTGYTYLEPGQVGVIKNNITGNEDIRTESGIIIHLPLGLTDVYKLDRKVQVFTMGSNQKSSSGTNRRGYSKRGRARSDNVKIKVKDGSNVELDVVVNFKIIPTKAAAIIKKVGIGNDTKNKMIRSYTRALVREKYGELKLEEVSDASSRTTKNFEVQTDLNKALQEFGIEVTLLNTTNFAFNPEYERLVKEKKATAQEFANQKSAQEKAMKEQEAQVAGATREKNTALITAEGEARKNLVEANNKAKQLVFRAVGEAYAMNKEGERSYEVAINDAKAIEAEGLNMAAGIKKLAEAYSRGGIALVKEALAKKMAGRRINGKPYSLSESIERLRVDRGAVAPGGRSGKGGR